MTDGILIPSTSLALLQAPSPSHRWAYIASARNPQRFHKQQNPSYPLARHARLHTTMDILHCTICLALAMPHNSEPSLRTLFPGRPLDSDANRLVHLLVQLLITGSSDIDLRCWVRRLPSFVANIPGTMRRTRPLAFESGRARVCVTRATYGSTVQYGGNCHSKDHGFAMNCLFRLV